MLEVFRRTTRVELGLATSTTVIGVSRVMLSEVFVYRGSEFTEIIVDYVTIGWGWLKPNPNNIFWKTAAADKWLEALVSRRGSRVYLGSGSSRFNSEADLESRTSLVSPWRPPLTNFISESDTREHSWKVDEGGDSKDGSWITWSGTDCSTRLVKLWLFASR